MMKSILCVLLFAALVLSGCGEKESAVSETGEDLTVPTVVSTVPANGAADVDPALAELSATFSEEMQDGNWSWAYTKEEDRPNITGKPYFDKTMKINKVAVKLEPGKSYEIWINSNMYKNFKDKAGNPAQPYKLTFSTKSR